MTDIEVGGTIYQIPTQPDIKNIDRHDLPVKEQKFTRIDHKTIGELPIDSQVELIVRELNRRRDGYWFMCKGIPTYITGSHYFYLTYWSLGTIYPEYRDSDRLYYYFWDYCVKDEDSYGMIYLTNRRDGKTERALSEMYETISRTEEALGGIQERTDGHAKKTFSKLIRAWKKLPEYLKPLDIGESDPKSKLDFSEPAVRSTKNKKSYKKALNSSIDYGSSKEEEYDGAKLTRYFRDETGKCLERGTPVLMFDGSIKKVEDIVPGDIIMGDDSTKRNVLSIARGQETMYKVVPKKGKTWGCNESHILSLKFSSDNVYKKNKKNDTINISVSDFLKLSKRAQKHLMQYKVPVEYPENTHAVEPYLLGLWLGDGAQRGPIITNELEINPLGNFLKENNLILNKHIPESFLIDSRKNRLKLLAGLLDTDGSLAKDRNYFEITQKNKTLSYQICNLANSLGFYASINKKMATIKREDSSIYSCEVFRVSIYGDNLYEIPCLIKKKQAAKVSNPHKNTRNPLRTGFKLVKKEVGDYYGFTIDGNRLFCLGDYTVTHNTTTANIERCWEIVKECLALGPNIIGKAILPTTVEELEKKGGKNFMNLFNDSFIFEKDENGRTRSGLYNYFKPAYVGLEGFVDEYGQSIIDDPLPEEKVFDSKGKRILMGSKTFLLNKRKNLKGPSLASEKRKFPFTIEEAFDVVFGEVWESDVKEILKHVRGEIMKSSDEIGTNKIYELNGIIHTSPTQSEGVKIVEHPKSNVVYKGGFDGSASDKQTGSDEGSSMAFVILKGFAGMDQLNYAPVCSYTIRPEKLEDAYNTVLLLCKYYNVDDKFQILGETNAGQGSPVVAYFANRGQLKLIMKRPKNLGFNFNDKTDKYWIYRTGAVKDLQIILANKFLRRYAQNIKLLSLVESLIKIGTANADEADAFLMAILGFGDFDKVEAKQYAPKQKMIPIRKRDASGRNIIVWQLER